MSGLFVLLLAIVWLAIAVWLSRWLGRKAKHSSVQSIIAVFAFSVLLPLPVADELIGMEQFHSLCVEGASVKINAQRIKGKSVRLVVSPSWAPVQGTAIPISYSRYSYIDAATDEELASYVDYNAKGGVLVHALGIVEGHAPLVIGMPWCGPPNRGQLAATYGFTLIGQ
jgi:hypothetical protein